MVLANVSWDKFFFRRCLVGAIITIDLLLMGAGFTFSATLLPQLERQNSEIKITRNEGTWIASMSSLTSIPGTIMGFFLLHVFGRKWAYSLVSFANIFAWLLLAVSTQAWHLLLGRAFQGFFTGLSYAACFCFMSEVVNLKYRSIFLNLINIGTSFGMLLADVLGTYYSWHVSAYVLSGFSASYFLILLYLKNTHIWYLQRDQVERARELYFWYNDQTPENEEKFCIERKLAEVKMTFKELMVEWKRREFLYPLGIILWFNTTCMSTGGFGIVLYSVEIMEGVVAIDEYMTTILIDILRMISTFVTITVLEHTSIRLVINVGSTLCASSLLLTSLSLYLKDTWSGWSTIALVAILSFNFFFNLSFVNIGNIYVGELFTGIGKSSGIALVGMSFYVLYFAYGQLVRRIFDNLGKVIAFLIFGICTIVGGIGLFIIMPETKGVSNEQFRENFRKKKRADCCEVVTRTVNSISGVIPNV